MRGFRAIIDIAQRTAHRGGLFLPRGQDGAIAFHRFVGARAWPGAHREQRFGRVHRAEFRVSGLTVVAFEEIFDDQFPVRRSGIAADMRDFGIGKAVVIENGVKFAEGGVKIVGRVFAQVDEDQAVKHADMRGKQAVVGLVEIIGHQPRRNQRAIKPECPGVIRADQPAGVALFGRTERRTAVPAHVEKRVDRIFGVADQDDLFLAHFEQHIVARIGDLRNVAGQNPFARDDFAHVVGKDRLAGVELAGQAVPGAQARGGGKQGVGHQHLILAPVGSNSGLSEATARWRTPAISIS